jgi:hypothetical protein
MVTVIGAPGYDDFSAELVIEIPRIGDNVMLSILHNPDLDEFFVIESEYVHIPEREEC